MLKELLSDQIQVGTIVLPKIFGQIFFITLVTHRGKSCCWANLTYLYI